jgi:hypothetical protein
LEKQEYFLTLFISTLSVLFLNEKFGDSKTFVDKGRVGAIARAPLRDLATKLGMGSGQWPARPIAGDSSARAAPGATAP